MNRKSKYLLSITAAIIILASLACFFIPRLLQCHAYGKLISYPLMLANLSVEPDSILMPPDNNSCTLSLGYARTSIQPELINSIKCRYAAVSIDCNDHTLLFMQPVTIPDGGSRESTNPPLVYPKTMTTQIYDSYDWGINVANTMPKNYFQIFLQSPEEFTEYFALALSKAKDSNKHNGISFFETKHLKGIIYFGTTQKPGLVSAEVYSKDSEIGQWIYANSFDPEKSRNAILSLLASYSFTISHIPKRSALHDQIISEIKNYQSFKPR